MKSRVLLAAAAIALLASGCGGSSGGSSGPEQKAPDNGDLGRISKAFGDLSLGCLSPDVDPNAIESDVDVLIQEAREAGLDRAPVRSWRWADSCRACGGPARVWTFQAAASPTRREETPEYPQPREHGSARRADSGSPSGKSVEAALEMHDGIGGRPRLVHMQPTMRAHSYP